MGSQLLECAAMSVSGWGEACLFNEEPYLKTGGTQARHSHLAQPHGSGSDRPSRDRMKALSCVLLLSFGACFPPNGSLELSYPRERLGATESQPDLWGVHNPKCKRSTQDLSTLVSIAKELQSFEQEKAGIRFRFGRQQDPPGEENEVLREEDGSKKRGDALENLAEKLNGYDRKKGGFSFRFGRGRRMAHF